MSQLSIVLARTILSFASLITTCSSTYAHPEAHHTNDASMLRPSTFSFSTLATGSNSQKSMPSVHKRVILIVGDSLSAGYGLRTEKAWVSLLEQRLRTLYPHYKTFNASISGETTSSGYARLPTLIETHQPDIIVLELGANDALRGLPLALTEQNLRAMIQAATKKQIKVLLVGMRLPPNYGEVYTNRFKQIFVKLAQQEKIVRVPFLMQGIAEDRSMFQADAIHPNQNAQPILLENIWETLKKMLK